MSKHAKFSCAVFVAALNQSGEVLLHRRAGTGFMDGCYDFLSGGVELGESLHDAAIREAEEEAGLIIAAENLQLVHVSQNYLDYPYMNFTFVSQVWENEPTIREPHKCDDMQFFAFDALPEQVTLNVRLMQEYWKVGETTYSKVDLDRFHQLFGREYASGK